MGSRRVELTEDRVAFGRSVEGASRVQLEGWPEGADLEILRVGPRYLAFDTSPEPQLTLDGQKVRRTELTVGAELVVGPWTLRVLEQSTEQPEEPEGPAERRGVIGYWPSQGIFFAEKERPARLQALSGTEAGLEVLIPPEGIVVGRDPGCDLSLSDPKVSARHCRIIRVGGEHVLRDLGSRNGTFLGERRVVSEVVAEGDEIRLGGVRLRLALLEGTLPTESGELPPTATDELMIFRVPQVLAHEIKNYLAVVGVSCEHLAASAQNREGRVPTALRSIARARGQIEHLLGLLRLAASEPRPEPADLTVVTVEQLALLEPVLERDGIRVELVLTRPLPVRLDRRQIGQVILNLLKNGCEAMPDGGRLEVITRKEDREVRLEITDSGPGITPETRERLFTPFFTTKPEGTGLGLYVSREILRRHGGGLSLETPEEPGGVSAVVRLPA